MSDEAKLQKKLQFLVEDYWDQPGHLRKKDLVEINRLRRELGLRRVDEALKEIGAPADEAAPEPEPEVDVHAEARELWGRYLAHEERLRTYRAHCARLIEATRPAGGQTPVYPLRYMGSEGDEMLCDHCGKGIVLEGGNNHGKTPKQAWPGSKGPGRKTTSYILGGVVFMAESNGTFRCFHGYIGRQQSCYERASRIRDEAEATFRTENRHDTAQDRRRLLAFFDEEGVVPLGEREEVLARLFKALYDFDPGLGVNEPF